MHCFRIRALFLNRIRYHENRLNYEPYFKVDAKTVKVAASVIEGVSLFKGPTSGIRLRRFHINHQSRATKHAHVKITYSVAKAKYTAVLVQ